MKKILILTVPSGGGHIQAAQALAEAGQVLYPHLEIKNINALDYSTRAARLAYQKAYLTLVKYMPALWGLIFNHSDSLRAKRLLDLTRRLQAINARPLIKFIQKWQPQTIVSTHFFENFVLHNQFKNGELSCPWYTVITDFYAHPLWLNEFATRYFVPAAEVRDQLIALQVPPDKVVATGIPLRQQFLNKFDTAAVCQKYHLDPNLPIVLALAGGFGLSELDKIVTILSKLPLPLQIIAVAGDNKRLENRLRTLRQAQGDNNRRLIVLGVVQNMAELMAVSTLAVTKAGAVTVSECLAMELPMIITAPIPGQEKANCDYLLKYNAAKVAENLPDLAQKVANLLNNKNELQTLAATAKQIAKPNAAANILKYIADKLPFDNLRYN